MTTFVIEIPFEKGVHAGLSGADPRLCPYGKMTKEWWEWQRGMSWAVGVTCRDDFKPVAQAQQ